MAKTMTRVEIQPGYEWTGSASGPLAVRLKNQGPVPAEWRAVDATPTPSTGDAGEIIQPGNEMGEIGLADGERLWLRNPNPNGKAVLIISTDDAGYV